MIFLTVGTSFPFDRLVRAMDELVTQGEIDAENTHFEENIF